MTKSRTQVRVDRKKCMGYANCLATAPDLFDLDDDGIAIVIGFLPDSPGSEELARRAARACPANAIEIIESEPT